MKMNILRMLTQGRQSIITATSEVLHEGALNVFKVLHSCLPVGSRATQSFSKDIFAAGLRFSNP